MSKPMNCPNCHTEIVYVVANSVAILESNRKAVAYCCPKCEAVLSIASEKISSSVNQQPKDAQ